MSGEDGRHEDEIDEDGVREEERGGEQGAKNMKEKKEKLKEREEKTAENSIDIITTLTTSMQNTVRAYVHGVCAVSLKATQALGDLHLVDKEEQGKKNKGNECSHSLVPILIFYQYYFLLISHSVYSNTKFKSDKPVDSIFFLFR